MKTVIAGSAIILFLAGGYAYVSLAPFPPETRMIILSENRLTAPVVYHLKLAKIRKHIETGNPWAPMSLYSFGYENDDYGLIEEAKWHLANSDTWAARYNIRIIELWPDNLFPMDSETRALQILAAEENIRPLGASEEKYNQYRHIMRHEIDGLRAMAADGDETAIEILALVDSAPEKPEAVN